MQAPNVTLPQVENMTSPRTRKHVANQYRIVTDECEVFQSYQTLIAVREFGTGRITLDKDSWDYSVTTGKYRNQFLGENITETRRKIKSGQYQLADLNPGR